MVLTGYGLIWAAAYSERYAPYANQLKSLPQLTDNVTFNDVLNAYNHAYNDNKTAGEVRDWFMLYDSAKAKYENLKSNAAGLIIIGSVFLIMSAISFLIPTFGASADKLKYILGFIYFLIPVTIWMFTGVAQPWSWLTYSILLGSTMTVFSMFKLHSVKISVD